MASFSQSADPGANVIVSKEEFNSFHNIDRQLFTRLVVGLGRDPTQSTHVMALFLWLETKSKNLKMVKNLLQWPDTTLNSLADQATLVLNYIECSQFPYSGDVYDKGLPLIQNIINNNTISLKYFHDNRVNIISSVTKLLNDVCVKAFMDIVQQVQYMKTMKESNYKIANMDGTMPGPYMQPVMYIAPTHGVTVIPQQVAVLTPQWIEGTSSSWRGDSPHLKTHYVSNQKEFNQEFSEILEKLTHTTIAKSDEKKELAINDRTIFMTFSRGYPVSETEVQDFFKRSYGDIIESLHMQEVVPPDQPLYARLVVRPEAVSMIDHFLESTSKVKLLINGKHVWARKYLHKGNKSPPATSPSTSQPPSPYLAGKFH